MARPRYRSQHGTPIEDAPWWVLAILTVLLWLVAFPALVGLLHGFGAWHGERFGPGLGAAALSLLVVIGLATRKPWRRPRTPALADSRPFFVRFSTWLWAAVLYPNVLLGAILLLRPGPPPDRRATLLLGVLLATLQTVMGWLGSRRRTRPL